MSFVTRGNHREIPVRGKDDAKERVAVVVAESVVASSREAEEGCAAGIPSADGRREILLR